GITGFNVPKGQVEADPRRFRADCWAVVAPLKGRVEEGQPGPEAQFLTNFITQVLSLPGGPVMALLNKVHPILGFCAVPEPGDCRFRLVDPGGAADRFAELGRYRVLSRAELDQPVTADLCAELGPAERIQLKYWSGLARPEKLRVGEVVFNFW